MSQANSFQRNDWETEFDELRNIPDEVLSVYEVYVKGDSPQDERSNISSVSGVSSGSDQSLVQELDTGDKNVIKIFGKKLDPQPSKNKIQSEENIVESVAVPQISANDSSTSRLIDKDDPRSRLHFVKYLKREGKTLKIWECGTKEFRHQYTLMRHLPTHTDERNFKCEACGKAFRQLSTLSQHKAIHSDARPYVCDFCKKTFNRVSTLISHRKTHSENKPHKCNVCGKGFHQKGNLRNHVFTHTNERPYKCELCNKGFNQMSNLVCHKVKSHAHVEKMQYSCGICGKEFPKRFALRSHEEAKHGIKYRNPSASQSRVTQSKKNIRIVELPNDNDNDNDNNNDFLETGDSLTENDKGKKLTEGIDNILLDKIETKAMENTILMGQMPFALYKPVKGIPNKSVQVKVPVVATVIQIIDDSGNSTYKVEPPSDSEPEPAQGGIQFVRATEDGRYEVMSNSEARDLMEQNSHDVTILDGAEAEAINIFNARNSSQGQIADDAIDNQIMVLDAGAPQKPMLVDDIEIHDDKDIRILDSKSFAAEMAFFGGNKLNDFIFGNKPMGFDSGISMINADDDVNSQELSNLLEPTINSHSTFPLLSKSDSLFETLNYLKSNRIGDDYGILNVDTSCMDSMDTYEDLSDASLLSMAQDIKVVTPRPKVTLPSFADMKVLGPKYQEFEAASQMQDIKIFGGYDPYPKNFNGYRLDAYAAPPVSVPYVPSVPMTSEDLRIHDTYSRKTTSFDNKLLDNIDLQEEIFVKVENEMVPISSMWDEYDVDINDYWANHFYPMTAYDY
ncbi:Similar to erm: Fez family zinc finger protein erm (Drosophila melanogaster) [Cotesia congregata]|uniref:Similar to erm: Fez family zinc finger protein erm (Drosophila melanogaster) n=1 Tax=Cotesia congregata TaxID=51543 RepID=A0A8J2MRS0_COTCN|nr:Similar to erm: Fez family zinc finger protein erm (Drosophila melanogaster) [Cotesia congregata]